MPYPDLCPDRLESGGTSAVASLIVKRAAVEIRMQRFPIDHESGADGFVLFGPVHQQVKASMVNVVDVLKIDVQLHIVRHTLQFRSKSTKAMNVAAPCNRNTAVLSG